MKTKEIKLNMTPITEKTFERQGWQKISVGDGESTEDEGGYDDYYYTIDRCNSSILRSLFIFYNY